VRRAHTTKESHFGHSDEDKFYLKRSSSRRAGPTMQKFRKKNGARTPSSSDDEGDHVRRSKKAISQRKGRPPKRRSYTDSSYSSDSSFRREYRRHEYSSSNPSLGIESHSRERAHRSPPPSRKRFRNSSPSPEMRNRRYHSSSSQRHLRSRPSERTTPSTSLNREISTEKIPVASKKHASQKYSQRPHSPIYNDLQCNSKSRAYTMDQCQSCSSWAEVHTFSNGNVMCVACLDHFQNLKCNSCDKLAVRLLNNQFYCQKCFINQKQQASPLQVKKKNVCSMVMSLKRCRQRQLIPPVQEAVCQENSKLVVEAPPYPSDPDLTPQYPPEEHPGALLPARNFSDGLSSDTMDENLYSTPGSTSRQPEKMFDSSKKLGEKSPSPSPSSSPSPSPQAFIPAQFVHKKKSSDFGVPAIIPEKRRKSKPPKVHKRAVKKSPLKMSSSPSPIGNVDVLIGQAITKGWELSADWSFGHIEAVPTNGKPGRLLDENQEEIVIGKLDLNAIKDPVEGQFVRFRRCIDSDGGASAVAITALEPKVHCSVTSETTNIVEDFPSGSKDYLFRSNVQKYVDKNGNCILNDTFLIQKTKIASDSGILVCRHLDAEMYASVGYVDALLDFAPPMIAATLNECDGHLLFGVQQKVHICYGLKISPQEKIEVEERLVKAMKQEHFIREEYFDIKWVQVCSSQGVVFSNLWILKIAIHPLNLQGTFEFGKKVLYAPELHSSDEVFDDLI